MLSFLYGTLPGRWLLRFMTAPGISRVCGWFLDTRISGLAGKSFLRRNHIDAEEFDLQQAKSFNDYFSRKILPGKRPVDSDPAHLIAPCDGYLSVHPITEHMVLPVKQSAYTLEELLRDPALAARYKDGLCLVFRLCVEHYHRYCYADSGLISGLRHIDGVLHTVRPVALKTLPVFCENTREYVLIRSAVFGPILQMEVGAMLVGRICNHPAAGQVIRGAQKGMFQYGGSTVILLLQQGKARLLPELAQKVRPGREVFVKQGQAIATAASVINE